MNVPKIRYPGLCPYFLTNSTIDKYNVNDIIQQLYNTLTNFLCFVNMFTEKQKKTCFLLTAIFALSYYIIFIQTKTISLPNSTKLHLFFYFW